MILFGWRKRIALSMCIFLFLGSVSYLTGVVNVTENEKSRDFKSSKYLDFFTNASLLRIFNKPSQATLAWETKGESETTNSFSHTINRRKFIDNLKRYVKSRIMSKLRTMNSKVAISEKDFEGYFLYKWISENSLLVTIKFKLLSPSKLSWYYDQFSISLNNN